MLTIHYGIHQYDNGPFDFWTTFKCMCDAFSGARAGLTADLTGFCIYERNHQKLVAFRPDKVTCLLCKESEDYKRDLITFEIGCDGSFQKWDLYLYDKRPYE